MKLNKLILAGTLAFLTACSTTKPVESAVSHHKCGRASWYALDGNRTANGEVMRSKAMTTAHRSLKFGTRLLVTNSANGKSVVVRVNDRGPFNSKILDLSKGAAHKIGMVGAGVGKVCYKILK